MLPDVPYAVYPGGQHIGTTQDFVGFIYLSLVNIRERPPEDETAPLRSNMGGSYHDVDRSKVDFVAETIQNGLLDGGDPRSPRTLPSPTRPLSAGGPTGPSWAINECG